MNGTHQAEPTKVIRLSGYQVAGCTWQDAGFQVAWCRLQVAGGSAGVSRGRLAAIPPGATEEAQKLGLAADLFLFSRVLYPKHFANKSGFAALPKSSELKIGN